MRWLLRGQMERQKRGREVAREAYELTVPQINSAKRKMREKRRGRIILAVMDGSLTGCLEVTCWKCGWIYLRSFVVVS